MHGFADRCLTTRPFHRGVAASGALQATRADDETRTRDPHLGKVMRYQLRYIRTVRDTGIEPVTSSVSGKRSPAELNAHNRLKKETRADDETRTRDPHLGKVMRYQLRYIRMHQTIN